MSIEKNDGKEAFEVSKKSDVGATIGTLKEAFKKKEITIETFNSLVLKLAEMHESKIKTLEEQLGIDFLTGLYNKRALATKLPELIERLDYNQGEHDSPPHSIMVIALDVNRFKFINDHYGHPKGDDALVMTAGRFHEVAREWAGQMVFRPGGDEFFMVIPLQQKELKEDELEVIFERIQAKINHDLSIPVNDEKFYLTLSMVFVVLKKPDSKDKKRDPKEIALKLIKEADQKLIAYKKASGIERGK